MISIRALLFNALCWLFLKPVLRFASLKFLVTTIPRLMDSGRTKPLPPGMSVQKALGTGYTGEWLRVTGTPTQKVILSLPGGGFVMRTVKMHRDYQAGFCAAAGCDALIVYYGLAPEAPFPAGLENCVAAYVDLLDRHYRPEDITLSGESAGGGLALSMLMVLRDRGLPMPGGVIAVSALADLTFTGDSRRRNWWRDPMLVNRRNSRMHELYIGGADPQHPYLSPALAGFDGFPPIFGIVGSTEILLDDTLRAFDQAQKVYAPFSMDIWRCMPHGFTLFPMIPESRIVIGRMAQFVNHRSVEPLPARYGQFQQV